MSQVSARVLAILGVILVGAGAGLLLQRTGSRDHAPVSGSASAPATQSFEHPTPVPAFVVQDLDGREISSAKFRDKVTLLNFWATWCPPCLAELPSLIELQKKYPDQLQVIGISEDDEPADAVRKFVTGMHVNYPVAMTTPEIEHAFPAVDSLPTSYFIDREGRIVQMHVGMLSPETTEREVQLLAGASASRTP